MHGRADDRLPTPADLPSVAELPNPLVMLDGSPVEAKEAWQNKRRPELKRLFAHYVYGAAPPAPKSIEAEVEWRDPQFLGGKATAKEVAIRYAPEPAPLLRLLVVTPNQRKAPAPVVVGMNMHGNHTVLPDQRIKLPTSWVRERGFGSKDHRATDAGRGLRSDVWSIEESIDRGYAIATFYAGDIDPDKPDWSDGVHPHFFAEGQTAPGPHEWGAIAAWAWGISRAVDYLQTEKELDQDRIVVFGHSRNGKTALLAGALDERIDLVIPHQAGCGGSSPSRSPVGEQIKQINDQFPHWFCATFKEFNQVVDKLPLDQHCLIALCAPRPVLLSNAQDDTWADPVGQFQALQAADPVYRMLGVDGLGDSKMPPVGELLDSRLGYFIRPGKHSTTPADWRVFLDFADKHFGKAKSEAP